MGYFLSLFSLSKSATETLLDVSEIILVGGGLILTIGAVGEYLEEHGKLPRWLAWPKLVFIIMVVAGLLGEFVSDAGVFVFSRHLQTIADSEIADLTKENTAAKKELEATFMRTRPRMIHDAKAFQGALKGRPKADVEILVKPEDEEAYMLGIQVRSRLTESGSGAGWIVTTFRPLRESDVFPWEVNHVGVPLALRSGAWHGLGLVVKSAPYPCFDHENDAAVCALQAALMASGAGGGQITYDPRMPNNVIKIIIGQEEMGH